MDGEVDWMREDQIRQRLYPLELATGAVLTVHAYSRRAWDSPLYRAMPFTQHVERDGIALIGHAKPLRRPSCSSTAAMPTRG